MTTARSLVTELSGVGFDVKQGQSLLRGLLDDRAFQFIPTVQRWSCNTGPNDNDTNLFGSFFDPLWKNLDCAVSVLKPSEPK